MPRRGYLARLSGPLSRADGQQSPSILAAHTGQYGPHPKRSVWLFVRRPRRPRQLHSSGNSSLRFRVQAPGSLLKNRERHSRHCSTLPRSSVSLRSQDEIRPVIPASLAGPPRAARQARPDALRGPCSLAGAPVRTVRRRACLRRASWPTGVCLPGPVPARTSRLARASSSQPSGTGESLGHFASVRSAPSKIASVRSARKRFAPVRSALVRSAPVRRAAGQVREDENRLGEVRRVKFAPGRIARPVGATFKGDAGFSEATFGQYASDGTFPGDQDTFNGAAVRLHVLANGR